jgi:uncharacterized membrane protein YeaQ/YmgE (transglycosylase-associated protein family)
MIIHIVWILVIGLIAGALARFVMPGRDPMGIWATIFLGVAGSFVGGFIATLLWRSPGQGSFSRGGLMLSVLGAILLLALLRFIRSRS